MIRIIDISLSQAWAEQLDAAVRNELRSLILRIADVAETECKIEEVRMNDARETPLISRHGKKIRVTGLDALMTQDYANAFARLLSHASDIEFCPGNEYGCASALAVEFARCGGKRVVVSFMGLGGYAPLEEVLLALRVTRSDKPGLDLSVLAELRAAFESAGAERVSNRKPVLGERIFHVESGIHVNGILKNAANYEPFSPETVGLRREIRLGKHSGESAIAHKLSELGIPVGTAAVGEILREVQAKSAELSRGISDAEFTEIVKGVFE